MRVFVERWFDDGRTLDVHWHEGLCRFEVCCADEVVFSAASLVEVLAHLLGAAPLRDGATEDANGSSVVGPDGCPT